MKRSTLARLERLERSHPPGRVDSEEARAQLCAALEAVLASEPRLVEPAELGGPHAELLDTLERLTECHATS